MTTLHRRRPLGQQHTDTGHQTLREMAQRVEAGTLDPMALVGAVYAYADERDRAVAGQDTDTAAVR